MAPLTDGLDNFSEIVINVDCLPIGPLDRYMRDVYSIATTLGGNKEQLSFEEYRRRMMEAGKDEDEKHPLLYNRRFNIDHYSHVTIVKFKGKDFNCYVEDGTPNLSGRYGDGPISLEYALKLINNPLVNEELNALED